MLPTFIISHYVWAVLIGLCAATVYRKSRDADVSMLEPFWKFFATWSVLFFLPVAGLIHIGYAQGIDWMMSIGYTLPHLFAFIATGYLWRVQSEINFPQYRKLFWAFAAYGVFVASYGLYEMPDVFLENGEVMLGPGSTFSLLIPAGMSIAGVFIAGSSFYSAWQLGGEARKKLSLIGVGALFAFIISATLHNIGMNMLGDISNLFWITCFMVVAYWQEVHDLGSRW